MGIKKGTKLTDNPKDYIFKVRMDNSTAQKLETVSEELKISRSEVIRNGIEDQYQKLQKK